MDINFELYKIFFYTVHTGSFSAAAGQLFITQSAVSQAIKSLETKLGAQLIFRTTRELKLTAEGAILFSHIEQAYNFIKTAEHKLSELQNLESGVVRIGASDTVCKYYLLPYLEKFNRQYPGIKVQMLNRTSPKILAALKNGSVDLGIITLPAGEKNLSIRELVEVTDIFVAAPKFAAFRNHKIPLSKLAGYPLLLLDQASATRRNLDDFLEKSRIRFASEIELESVDLLVEFAKIGLGVAHVLRESAQAAMERGELFEVETEEKLPPRLLGVATLKDVPLSRAAEGLMGMLGER